MTRTTWSVIADYRHEWWPFLRVLLLIAAIATPIFALLPLDIAVANLLYGPSGFVSTREPMIIWFRSVSSLPQTLMVIATVVGLLLSLKLERLIRYRLHMLFIILCLALGPWIAVNRVSKKHSGRPRPREIVEYGGHLQYRAPLHLGQKGRGLSFPCGEAAYGYYLMVFYFLLRRKRRKIAWAALAGAILYGSVVGFMRMLVGGHFLSDVVWAYVFIGGVCWLTYYVILNVPAREDGKAVPWTLWGSPTLFRVVLLKVLIAIFAWWLVTMPHYRLRHYIGKPDKGVTATELHISARRGDVCVSYTATNRVFTRVEAYAVGHMWSWLTSSADLQTTNQVLSMRVNYDDGGWFFEHAARVTADLPTSGLRALRVTLEEDGRVCIPDPPADSDHPFLSIEQPGGQVLLGSSWRRMPMRLNVGSATIEYNSNAADRGLPLPPLLATE